jgi:hypothetical protein
VIEIGAQQQKQTLEHPAFIVAKGTFSVKRVIFVQQDAIKVNQPQQQ